MEPAGVSYRGFLSLQAECRFCRALHSGASRPNRWAIELPRNPGLIPCLPKMQAQIVLREVACASANFVELHELARAHGDARANRGAVALRSDEPEQHAVISGDAVVQQ